MTPPEPPMVRVTESGECTVIEFSNPPLNTSTAQMRRQLLEAIDTVNKAAPRAAVLIGAGGTFISGSDVKEFAGDISHPQLPELTAAIESSPTVFVAALDGYALGGGLELALACDYRIGTSRLTIGLPELEWGVLPGGGGIQRLTRLVGKLAALELIMTSERVPAERARRLGVISEVVQPDALLESATAIAPAVHKSRLTEMAVPPGTALAFAQAAEKYRRIRRGYPGVEDTIHLIDSVDKRPPDAGLADERERFHVLRASKEAAAFRHIRFAEMRAGKGPRPRAGATRPPRRVGVVGAGAMGGGIARLSASCGNATLLYDLDPDRARTASDGTSVEAVEDLAGLKHCDLIIEAIAEDMPLKMDLLRELEAVCSESCMLASNTSYLDLNELASALAHPERFIGIHFFNPADRMRLVEVIPHQQTGDEILRSALSWARSLGKTPIVARVSDGFVANRLFSAYRRECETILQDGAYVDQVDAALKGFGFRMGPFEVADLSGLDIAWSRRRRLAEHRDPHERYVDIPDRLCELGRFGRKTQAGYYRYASPTAAPEIDAQVTALVLESSDDAKIIRRRFPAADIVGRAIAALVNEASHLLEQGIASRPGDIDVAAVLGYGFPRQLGGPLWWSARQGIDEHTRHLRMVVESGGSEIDPVWDVSALFRSLTT